jgi:hypothetical protein
MSDIEDQEASWTRRGFLRLAATFGAGFTVLSNLSGRAEAVPHKHCQFANLASKYLGFFCAGPSRYNTYQEYCLVEGFTLGGSNCGAAYNVYAGNC